MRIPSGTVMRHLAIWFTVAYVAAISIATSCSRSEPARHVYVVSTGIEVAVVTVFDCSNIGFEERDKAEKYSAEHPGTHVFEVSFHEVR